MKKIISMILVLVMVFAMGATAFAANDTTISPPKHDHEWSEWEEYEDRIERYCEVCGVTEIIYLDADGEGEENPETGASAALGMAAIVSAAAVASFKRRK